MFVCQWRCTGMGGWGRKGLDDVIEAQEEQDCVP